MRLAVVGAGAMGATLAVEAALAGHDVSVLDVNTDLVRVAQDPGLTVQSGGETLRARVYASDDPADIGPVDLVVVFVKAQHTAAAAGLIDALRGPDTVVASLQNGWGNTQTLVDRLGPDRVVYGVTYHSCSVLSLGVVAHTGRGETFVGPYAGSDLGPSQALVTLFESMGWPVTATADVTTEIWKKLILNAATLPTAALTLLPAGELAQGPRMHELVDTLAAEACAVAVAKGLAVDESERVTRIHAVLKGAGAGKASMLQDVLGKRKTEIETINAAIVREAAELGVAVPVNRAMVALIEGLERSWTL